MTHLNTDGVPNKMDTGESLAQEIVHELTNIPTGAQWLNKMISALPKWSPGIIFTGHCLAVSSTENTSRGNGDGHIVLKSGRVVGAMRLVSE
jgi:hypothetical protein